MPNKDVLIITFEGDYGVGCRGNGDATFISTMIDAARASWPSSCFVLDYRAMSYEWGDMLPLMLGPEETSAEVAPMHRAFGAMPYCCATLISDLNREAIASLLASAYGYGSDPTWLFDGLGDALEAFEGVWRQMQEEMASQ